MARQLSNRLSLTSIGKEGRPGRTSLWNRHKSWPEGWLGPVQPLLLAISHLSENKQQLPGHYKFRAPGDSTAQTWRTFGRCFVVSIRGLTGGFFLGGPEPPVPAISGQFGEVRGVRAGIQDIDFERLPRGRHAQAGLTRLPTVFIGRLLAPYSLAPHCPSTHRGRRGPPKSTKLGSMLTPMQSKELLGFF